MNNRGGLNTARPLIMHIDLNSCFATIEQQSRPLLRGRPVAVVNRRIENTSIITASYEAKARGIKVGMRVRDARLLCPDIVTLESDPPKYRYVYRKLMGILADYSARIHMKSIDEGVIDFSESTAEYQRSDLRAVGEEIKQRLRDEIGGSMRCNVGIGPNRFLAKTAAGMNKPDGLTVIDAGNVREVYARLELEDLTGIAGGYGRRLRQVGITTPLEFLDTSQEGLEKMVFKSVCGRQWFERLRGWEVDEAESPLKTAGRQYVLDDRELGHEAVLQRMHGLCEDVVAKLRSQQVKARGVRVYAKTYHQGKWKAYTRSGRAFHDERTLFATVRELCRDLPLPCYEIGVSCYDLASEEELQLGIFLADEQRTAAIVDAIDSINTFWGAHTVHSAHTLGINGQMKRKIPFGGTRYL